MRAVLLLAGMLAAGCQDLPDQRAERLVEAYNRQLVEAFRAGDARLVEGVAGERELRKVAGLIGVKLDQGVTLDAELEWLAVIGIARARGRVSVLTSERWSYQHREIGSGRIASPSSVDRYRLEYVLLRSAGRWRVDEVRFLAPPQIGDARAVARLPRDVHAFGPAKAVPREAP